jgi:putative ABC transport system permease protein
MAIALSNLTGNKLRTLLTVVGIGLGIATIVFLVSLGYGLQELSLSQLASLEAVSTVSVSAGRLGAPDQALATQYAQDARVEKVVAVNSVSMQAGLTGDKHVDGVASLVPTDFFGLEGIKADSGAAYPADASKGVVVSSGLVSGLGTTAADLIGKELSLSLFITDPTSGVSKPVVDSVKVYGTYTDDTTVAAYVSPDLLKETGPLPISQLKLKVKDRTIIPAFKSELEAKGYAVTAVADTIDQLNTIFKVIQGVLAGFGAIGLLVASIGMFNTMTIALLERTREVGIMKAIGVEDKNVYLLFLMEAMLISLLGGLSGLIIGWTSAKAINIAVNLLAHYLGGQSVQLFYTPPSFVLLMLSFSLLVGFLTGFMPARRGSKINPLDALRYE